jgi:hypothetical protein
MIPNSAQSASTLDLGLAPTAWPHLAASLSVLPVARVASVDGTWALAIRYLVSVGLVQLGTEVRARPT